MAINRRGTTILEREGHFVFWWACSCPSAKLRGRWSPWIPQGPCSWTCSSTVSHISVLSGWGTWSWWCFRRLNCLRSRTSTWFGETWSNSTLPFLSNCCRSSWGLPTAKKKHFKVLWLLRLECRFYSTKAPWDYTSFQQKLRPYSRHFQSCCHLDRKMGTEDEFFQVEKVVLEKFLEDFWANLAVG